MNQKNHMNQPTNPSLTENFFNAATPCLLVICFICWQIPSYANQPGSYYASKYKRLTASSEGQSNTNAIRTWFNNYDQIRRQAQLSPAERQNADQIMGKGLAIFMPGPDKALAQNLLVDLVNRYTTAAQQMSSLQIIPATEQLHRGYYQYFIDAKHLFEDYLKVQDDLMAVDTNTGQPVASGLVERKQNLALLDQSNKTIDEKLRGQYGIAPYQYQPPQN